GGRPVSVTVTDHYRQIKGWEKNIVDKDHNLRHWTWIPMLEAGRSTIKLAPGQTRVGGGIPEHKSFYKKPQHIATIVPRSSRSVPRYVPLPSRNDVARHSN